MNFKLQRRLASKILKCGVNRVKFILPEDVPDDVIERIENAITRSDVRNLLNRYHPIDRGGVIGRHQKKGVSRGRARHQTKQKLSGRRHGPGSRRGGQNARTPRKAKWMRDIRAVRRTLSELRESGKITRAAYREYYVKSKGGAIRSRARVQAMLVAGGHLKLDAKAPTAVAPSKPSKTRKEGSK